MLSRKYRPIEKILRVCMETRLVCCEVINGAILTTSKSGRVGGGSHVPFDVRGSVRRAVENGQTEIQRRLPPRPFRYPVFILNVETYCQGRKEVQRRVCKLRRHDGARGEHAWMFAIEGCVLRLTGGRAAATVLVAVEIAG